VLCKRRVIFVGGTLVPYTLKIPENRQDANGIVVFTKRLGSWPVTRFLGVALLLQTALLSADPVRVRYTEGSIHGFLALRTMQGKLMAEGDLIQVTQGDR
jgi:hypothetical protein